MRNTFIYLFIITTVFLACEDIFVSDLSDEQVILLAPAENLSTDITNHTFWWETIEGAESYQLQIATPSFLDIEQLITDTVVATDKFTQSLAPDDYEWRLRALNGGSETNYVVRNLTIENSADISRQRVILNYPENNFVTNGTSLSFRWEKLYNADSYLLEWKYENGDYAQEPLTVETNYTELQLDEENNFLWSIKGYNSSSGTYSIANERHIIVDRTPPLQAQLVSPSNTEEITVTDKKLSFSWTRDAQSGSAEFDSLFIYKGAQNPVLLTKVKSTDFSYTWQNATAGEYSYSVKAYDIAGNEGTVSDTFSFTIKEETTGQ